jgi:hypothetical protein
MMRAITLAAATWLLASNSIIAGAVRHFDLKTREHLGLELARVSRRADHGASDASRKKAQQTAIAAVRARIMSIPYDYLVVDDPDGHGFLVYVEPRPNIADCVMCGDIRVSVSADGLRAERIDEISKWLFRNKIPAGGTARTIGLTDPAADIPMETYLYRSEIYGVPICVGTPGKPGIYWFAANRKIFRLTGAQIDALGR